MIKKQRLEFLKKISTDINIDSLSDQLQEYNLRTPISSVVKKSFQFLTKMGCESEKEAEEYFKNKIMPLTGEIYDVREFGPNFFGPGNYTNSGMFLMSSSGLYLLTDLKIKIGITEDLIISGSKIKNLILYKFKFGIGSVDVEEYLQNYNIENITTPITSQYFWLFEAILKVIDKNSDSSYLKNAEFIKSFDKLVKENRGTLSKIDSYRTLSVPKFLGQGAFGAVYLLDPGENPTDNPNILEAGGRMGKVIKIHADRDGHQSNRMTLRDLYVNPNLSGTEMRIYENGRIGGFTIPNGFYPNSMVGKTISIYYSIMNLVKPITLENQKNNYDLDMYEKYGDLDVYDVLDEIEFKLHDVLYREDYQDQFNRIREISEQEKNDLIANIDDEVSSYIDQNKLEFIKENFNLKDDWLNRFIEEYCIKWITGRRDLHFGNLGVNSNGYLVFYDSYAPVHDQENIRNIKKKREKKSLRINNIYKVAQIFYLKYNKFIK